MYDSPLPFMPDLCFWLSPTGPQCSCGRQRGLSVLARGVSMRAWGLRLRGVDCALACNARRRVAFRVVLRRRHPGLLFSELNGLPTYTPVQRFKCALTGALAWLGAKMVRYSFLV